MVFWQVLLSCEYSNNQTRSSEEGDDFCVDGWEGNSDIIGKQRGTGEREEERAGSGREMQIANFLSLSMR